MTDNSNDNTRCIGLPPPSPQQPQPHQRQHVYHYWKQNCIYMRPNAHTRIAHASCPDPTWALAWRCQCLHSAPINKYAYHTCANLIRACLISIYYTCIYERSELYKSEAYIEQVGHGRRAYAILHTLWSRTNIINITYNSQFTIHNSDIACVIYMYIV